MKSDNNYSYELSDGQLRGEKGELKQVGDSSVFIVSGAYSFYGSDGKHYHVEYKADENGYRAKTSVEGFLIDQCSLR